jgi:hypothetical protein
MTSGRLRTSLYVAAALAAGLLLRLWFVAHLASVNGDTLIYGNIAKNWLQHGVYGFLVTANGPQPTLIRLPGYPMFLAACFSVFGIDRYTPVLYVQCAFDLFSCLLIAGLAGRLFGSRARMAALWLACLCPFTANYTAAPLTEVLTLWTIALTFYALERWRAAGGGINQWVGVLGLAMAYSLLLRPEQGLLAAAVVPAMLWLSLGGRDGRQEWVRAALPALLVSLCVLLPLVPWTARNWRTFHVVQPLAPRSATDPGEDVPVGFNRWYRTWGIDYASTEEVYWNYDNSPIDIGDLPARAFDSAGQYGVTRALLADYNKTASASPGLDARFEQLARQRIHADPLRYYLALPVARLLNMALRPRAELMNLPIDWWEYGEHPRQTLEAVGLAALNVGYFGMGVVGVMLWRRRGWGVYAPLVCSMLALALLRCGLLLTLDNSEPRYTLELFPVLMVWAGFLFRSGSVVLPPTSWGVYPLRGGPPCGRHRM